MLATTEPQATEREAADDDDDLCHLVCTDHAPDRSLCGRDVSGDPWLRQGQPVLECVVCDDIDEMYERQGWCCASGVVL